MTIRIELPLPPSINGAYCNRKGGGGRYPSKTHRQWKIDAGNTLLIVKPGKVTGPYKLAIMLPLGLRGDVSNRIKLAEDLLVSHGVTPDDRNAVSVLAHRSEGVPAGKCIVVVEAV